MDFERGIETQRVRLLRLLAGLVVLLGFLSLGPISRSFSKSVCGYVGSVLCRAELAAQYLVIAQARLMSARNGMAIDRDWFSGPLAYAFDEDDADVSLSDCRARLRALRAVLSDLPRHALRLIRRIEKQICGADRSGGVLPRTDRRRVASLLEWRLGANCIERPPDKTISVIAADFTSPRNPGGRRLRFSFGLTPLARSF